MKFYLRYVWQESSTSKKTIPHKDELKAQTFKEALEEGMKKAEELFIGCTMDIGFFHLFEVCADINQEVLKRSQ